MNLKKIIVFIIFCAVLLITVLVFMPSNKNKEENIIFDNSIDDKPSSSSNEQIQEDTDYDNTLKDVSVRNNYYNVKTCIDKFYSYYIDIFNETNDGVVVDEYEEKYRQEQKKENATAIYNILDSKYINYKKITEKNILDNLPKIKRSNIDITDMYVSEKTDNIAIYFVNGKLREMNTKNITNFSVMVTIDSINKTFSICLEDYIKDKYPSLKKDDKLDIETPTSIDQNKYNVYKEQYIVDQVYVKDMINKYIDEMIYNPSQGYNQLDKQYREKRFKKLENYLAFAKDVNNVRKYLTIKIEKYQKTEEDGYTQYVCIDQNENYYIIHEYSTMNYSLILDTYTIDLPEFIEKYNKSSEKEKIALNIKKILDAINLQDYSYIYDKLDDTFKANNFKTESQLKQYIQKNFYNQNKIEYKEVNKSGNTYIYTVEIYDKNDSSKFIKKDIIMELREGTQFVMSFNVN